MDMKGYTQWGVIILILIGILIVSQYKIEKTKLEVSVFNDKIENATIIVKEVPIFSLLTKPPELSGNYRIYLEITSEKTKETILISAKDRVGEDKFNFDIIKPTFDDIWKIQVSLKKYDRFGNLIEKDKFCLRVEWLDQNVREERKIYC